MKPASPESDAPRPQLYLPQITDERAVLGLVLMVELTAVLLTLARDNDRLGFWTDLARTSLFLMWIGISSAVVLHLARKPIERATVARGSLLVLGLITSLVATISAVTYLIGQSLALDDELLGGRFPQQPWNFIVRNAAIGFIVTGIALRYFYVSHQWRRNVEMQAQARVHALQARIRPHFLFNSMNTIASLTRSSPARAEEAVQDLADLFRATLSDTRSEIALSDELEVAHTYVRIEKLRLGERLQVQWNTAALPAHAVVPSLIVQPLLENAIYHGIEPRPEGGTVTVNGEFGNEQITIVVRNPLPEGSSTRDGNRLALANIRERLTLVYGARATIKAGRFDDEYIVTLRFPFVAPRSASGK